MKKFIAILVLGASLGSCTYADIITVDPNNLSPITDTIRYNPEVQQIMFDRCVTCHGGPAPSAGLDLSIYSGVRNATENGSLINRINSESAPMPTSGLMDAELRQQIQKWADDGYLQ